MRLAACRRRRASQPVLTELRSWFDGSGANPYPVGPRPRVDYVSSNVKIMPMKIGTPRHMGARWVVPFEGV